MKENIFNDTQKLKICALSVKVLKKILHGGLDSKKKRETETPSLHFQWIKLTSHLQSGVIFSKCKFGVNQNKNVHYLSKDLHLSILLLPLFLLFSNFLMSMNKYISQINFNKYILSDHPRKDFVRLISEQHRGQIIKWITQTNEINLIKLHRPRKSTELEI